MQFEYIRDTVVVGIRIFVIRNAIPVSVGPGGDVVGIEIFIIRHAIAITIVVELIGYTITVGVFRRREAIIRITADFYLVIVSNTVAVAVSVGVVAGSITIEIAPLFRVERKGILTVRHTVVIHVRICEVRNTIFIGIARTRADISRVITQTFFILVGNAITINIAVTVIAHTIRIHISPVTGIAREYIFLVRDAIVVHIIVDGVGDTIPIRIRLIGDIRIETGSRFQIIGQAVSIAVSIQMISDTIAIKVIQCRSSRQ